MIVDPVRCTGYLIHGSGHEVGSVQLQYTL